MATLVKGVEETLSKQWAGVEEGLKEELGELRQKLAATRELLDRQEEERRRAEAERDRLLEERDRRLVEEMRQVLQERRKGPVLILMDELIEYAVKAKDFADQISAFSHELTETVKSKDNVCLVCTLPSSVPYGEAGERALNELQRIYGRVEAVYTPVEGIEIYEVIRNRLFEDFGDEKTIKEVAQGYFDLYQKLGPDVPPEVREIEYRDRIEHAYPFHPELIDVLYERWGVVLHFLEDKGGFKAFSGSHSRPLQAKNTVSSHPLFSR